MQTKTTDEHKHCTMQPSTLRFAWESQGQTFEHGAGRLLLLALHYSGDTCSKTCTGETCTEYAFYLVQVSGTNFLSVHVLRTGLTVTPIRTAPE